ncbi:E3 ubiquitin-protein ligase TRIM21-like [Fundulus heteroclitus]|uniref:E3 ubiquitin-protein ligase TRIM21-like n=1 Tax=Fundulus heteroclitus TaxID=8078 RepID=UPI00165A3323|nr:E3 ubiquitin-protein ligase TRIM21-like [Fundulus heteroclitus]
MEKEKDKEVELKAEDVLHALDELSDKEFERFKWYLQQPESLPGVPPLRKAHLERAESLNIVDLMVQTYTLQRSMEVTINILKKINRNDLLQRFSSEKDMCPQHIKPLKLFCENDKKRLCHSRSVFKHKKHNVVPLSKEHEGKKGEPRKTDNEVNRMIQCRRLKIKEIRKLMKTSKDAADREKAEAVQVFTALKEAAERGLKELIKEIQDKQKTTDREGEDFIKDLKKEISELKMSSQVDSLQRFSSLKAAPPTKNWTEVRVHPPSYEGTVVRAVDQLKDTLWEDMKKMLELKRVQQYAVDVTLDPNTAHPKLILSDDGKQVKHGDVWKELPNNPERFWLFPNVLGKQSFSSGRFYFEVQVKGKTDWDLGVARESIDRKGKVGLSPQNGFWVIVSRDGYHYSGDDISVPFNLQPGPEKVGVFVDYEEGLVSFYDVDAAALIYSFTGCCFTEKLYPFFSPCLNDGGKNSAPLIICPVNRAHSCSDES